jgi:hypothetical protein
VAAHSNHCGAERGELPRENPSYSPEPEQHHRLLAELPHCPSPAPLPGVLLRNKPRQTFRSSEQPEEGKLRQRLTVHSSRGGERHAFELFRRQGRRFYLGATAGRHDLHPTQARVGSHRPSERCRVDIGYAVKDIRCVDEVVEAMLLWLAAMERRVTREVGGPTHGWEQRLLTYKLDARFGIFDKPAQGLIEWCRNDDPD